MVGYGSTPFPPPPDDLCEGAVAGSTVASALLSDKALPIMVASAGPTGRDSLP
jgi:hypothetical protein